MCICDHCDQIVYLSDYEPTPRLSPIASEYLLHTSTAHMHGPKQTPLDFDLIFRFNRTLSKGLCGEGE